jgi:hypothetical protein
MNVNQRLDRIEQKLDRLLAARDIDPNPGVVIEAGERFAPGSGSIPTERPPVDEPGRSDDPAERAGIIERARSERAAASADARDLVVYATGLLCTSVCTSLEDDDEVERRVNRLNPTGIPSPWRIDSSPTFSDGTPNPCPCPDTAGHRHVLLSC